MISQGIIVQSFRFDQKNFQTTGLTKHPNDVVKSLVEHSRYNDYDVFFSTTRLEYGIPESIILLGTVNTNLKEIFGQVVGNYLPYISGPAWIKG